MAAKRVKMSAEDLDILARTIYGESRGEPMQGKIAVAYSVINRVKAKSWFGDSISEVCKKKYQYSCWNEKDPNKKKIEKVTLDTWDFQLCYHAALSAGCGLIADPTSGSTHYHTIHISPDWAKGKEPVCTINVIA
jgi:N-acetylmuramoyl-L-alanine amidase